MKITGRLLAVIIISVAVILAGAAVGVAALVRSGHSATGSYNGGGQSQSADQQTIAPPGTSSSGAQQNNNSGSSNNSSTSGSVVLVPVGPLIHEQDGTTQQSVRVTVNNTVIVTTKVTTAAGGWFVITGWNTWAGTTPPPWTAVRSWRAVHPSLNPRDHSRGGINAPFPLPSVVGLTQHDAQNILSARKLTVAVQTVHQSGRANGVANGNVLREVPGAGTIVGPGDVVTIYVEGPTASTSPTTQVPVPSVIGTDAATAQQILHGAGFAVVTSTVPGPAGATPGNVFSQTPSGGTLPKGGTVTIEIAAKPVATATTPTPTPTPTTPTPPPNTPTSPPAPPTSPTSPTSPASPAAPSGQQASSGSQPTG